MNESLKIGLLGCGVITQRTLSGLIALLAERDAAITALCDVSTSNMDAVSRLYDHADLARYDSLDAMLDGGQINTLFVATPIAMHYDNVKQGLLSGCHVYTHKTLSPTPRQCEELAIIAQSKGVRLAASPGQILLPAYKRALSIIRSGELGDLVSIDAAAEAAAHRWEAERADEDPAENQVFSWEWYHSEEKGGGPLDDMFVYPLAFLCELLGEVTDASVHSRLVNQNIEWKGRRVIADAPDSYCGVVRFGNVAATVRSSFGSNSSRVPWGFVSIRGTQAALEIEKTNDREYSLYITPNGQAPRVEKLDVFDEVAAERFGSVECHVLTDMRELMDAALEGRDVEGATAINAARVARSLALIKESASAGGRFVAAGN